ncbi:MAG: PAS domain S-box protein, partial [Chloroflexota bacterium]
MMMDRHKTNAELIAELETLKQQVTHLESELLDRQKTEQSLQENKLQFQNIFNLSPIGVVISGLDGVLQQVNQAFCSILGYAEEELVGHYFAKFAHPDDLELNFALLNRLRKGEIPHFQMEKRYFAKDGVIIHTILQVTLVRDTRNKPRYFIAQVVDITGRKWVEADTARQTRFVAFSAEIGLALTQDATSHAILQKCAEAMVTHLDAVFSRIWIFNPALNQLELQASAGLHTHLDGPHAQIPVDEKSNFKLSLIAQTREPILTNR